MCVHTAYDGQEQGPPTEETLVVCLCSTAGPHCVLNGTINAKVHSRPLLRGDAG